MLKKKFDEDAAFEIEYEHKVLCERRLSCPFHKEEECQDVVFKRYDLKGFYDTCMEEQTVGDYRADLLLVQSTKKDREPVLIEILVTHPCSEEKRSSGRKIIEIEIHSEEDIWRLAKGAISEKSGLAAFHGFKKESKESVPLIKRSLFRFYLFQSGKAFVSNFEDMPKCNKGRMNAKAILELNIDGDKVSYFGDTTVYDYGMVYARNLGYDVKNCYLCRFHRSGYETSMSPIFCCLYKKYGTPQYPEVNEASRCAHFSLDNERIRRIKQAMPPIQKL